MFPRLSVLVYFVGETLAIFWSSSTIKSSLPPSEYVTVYHPSALEKKSYNTFVPAMPWKVLHEPGTYIHTEVRMQFGRWKTAHWFLLDGAKNVRCLGYGWTGLDKQNILC
jgi:hypothetical protein